MYILCIYKKNITLRLFKIDALNFTMYILTILTSPLKIRIIELHNLISINIFFNIKEHLHYIFFANHFFNYTPVC